MEISWETDKVDMEVSHTFEFSMEDKKKKSYGVLKSTPKRGRDVGRTTILGKCHDLSI